MTLAALLFVALLVYLFRLRLVYPLWYRLRYGIRFRAGGQGGPYPFAEEAQRHKPGRMAELYRTKD